MFRVATSESMVQRTYSITPNTIIVTLKFLKTSVGRCVILCAFFDKSVKHAFSCRKMYPV